MRILRRKTFETNSSSTHSLVICSDDDYNKWKNGELYYDSLNERFCTEEEFVTEVKKSIIYERCNYDTYKNSEGKYATEYMYNDVKADNIEDLCTEENLNTLTKEDIDEFIEDFPYDIPFSFEHYKDYYEDFEQYKEDYTTKSGDKIVAFGYYGFDG